MSENTKYKGRDEKGKFIEGNQISVGNNGGRPTDFKEEFIDLAYKFTLLGATDKILADYFEVDESTINDWKIKTPEFSESIKKGKELADSQVAESLFTRAKGFSKMIQKPIKLKTQTNGEGSKEHVELAEEEQYFPPDTTAMIFWLKNRQPELWRDKQQFEVTPITNKPNPFAHLSREELEQIDDILNAETDV